MLLVFGDSITHGLELQDCPYDKIREIADKDRKSSLNSSKYSWPALLGANGNISVPGLANQGIQRLCTTITSDCKPKKVIIAWTFKSRVEFHDDDLGFHTYRSHYTDSVSKLYFKKLYSDLYGMYLMLNKIYHTQLHLRNLKIDYFMTLPTYKVLLYNNKNIMNYKFETEKEHYKNDSLLTHTLMLVKLINWSKFMSLKDNIYWGILDLGYEIDDIGPHGHPLEKTHKLVAKHILEMLK